MSIATIISETGTSTSASLSLTYSGSVGNVGASFSGAFNASGGVGPYTYTIFSGSLPPGLSLTASGVNAGVVSGTPTTVGGVAFDGRVTDSVGAHADYTGTIIIEPSGIGPFTDTLTSLVLTVVYKPGNSGNYLFQVNGTYTIPTATANDSSFSYVTAGIFVHGATPNSVNTGFLLGNITPPTHSWTGAWIDVPAGASTQYDIYAWPVNIWGVPSSSDVTGTITVSVALAQAYVNGGTTTVGAEIPNCTLSSAQVDYETSNSQDGVEQYQIVFNGTAPTDPRFGSGQGVLCPIAYLVGYNGTLNASIPSTGSTVVVNVTPYAPLVSGGIGFGVCVVASDGITITGITNPIAPALAGNFVAINSTVYQVQTYLSSSSCVLNAGSGATAGTHSWQPLECRYGMAQGDTLQIDNEQFTLTTESQTITIISGQGVSTWMLTRLGTGVTHATGGGKLIVDVISPAGNVDDYAGSLVPGKTQGVSPRLPIGLPTAYIFYLVSESTTFVLNAWPVVGVTPSAIIGAIEAQTTGNLQTKRLATTQMSGITVLGGKLVGTSAPTIWVPNGDFEYGTYPNTTTPVDWTWTGTAGAISVQSGVVQSGKFAVEFTGNGQFSSVLEPCVPGQQFAMNCYFSSGASPNGTVTVQIAYFNAAQAFIGSTPSTMNIVNANGIWLRFPSTANTQWNSTAPSGAAYVDVIFQIAGLTSGFLCIDNVSMQLIVNTSGLQIGTGPVGDNGLGGLTILGQSIQTQYIANNAITAALTAIAAISPVSGQLAPGVAAANLVANSLNANVVQAENGVFVQLVAGTVTAAISFTAPEILVSNASFLITLNSGETALSIYSVPNQSIIDLTDGMVNITVTSSIPGEAGAVELTSSSLLFTPQPLSGGIEYPVSIVSDTIVGSLQANNQGSSRVVQMEVNGSGAWYKGVTDALDPSAGVGSTCYLTTNTPTIGFWVKTSTLHTTGAPSGWFLTLAD